MFPALPALDDSTLFAVVLVGLVFVVFGHLWLAGRAFRVGTLWGLGVLVVPPVGLVFALRHFRRAAVPLVLTIGGWLLVGGGFTVAKLRPVQTTAVIQTAPATPTTNRESAPVEEYRLTLTGTVRDEYLKLMDRTDYAVVQWANADVTDEDLKLLRGQTRLRELDLNSTQLTDAGLAHFAHADALEVLRLAGTQITAAAFEQLMQAHPNLRELDARRTAVPKDAARAWKAAKPGRKLAI